jgi:glutamyl-tRNA reductase
MELADLHLLHMPKHGAIASGAQPFSASGRALVLDTCLRRVAVTASGAEAARLSRFGELLQGVAAYQFLLELAAGLKSAVVGESEILGQLRSAWSAVEGSSSRLAEELSPVMQRLFADVKEVRERYLRGAGGQSYGSLLRKILHSTASGPTLLVGA